MAGRGITLGVWWRGNSLEGRSHRTRQHGVALAPIGQEEWRGRFLGRIKTLSCLDLSKVDHGVKRVMFIQIFMIIHPRTSPQSRQKATQGAGWRKDVARKTVPQAAPELGWRARGDMSRSAGAPQLLVCMTWGSRAPRPDSGGEAGPASKTKGLTRAQRLPKARLDLQTLALYRQVVAAVSPQHGQTTAKASA